MLSFAGRAGSGERNYGGLMDAFELLTYEWLVKEVMETLGEIEVEWAVGGLCERRVVHPATEEMWERRNDGEEGERERVVRGER